jgi:hypothetical protein
MKVHTENGDVVEIERPKYCVGHTTRNKPRRAYTDSETFTQRGWDDNAEYYYDAWYVVDGKVYFPIDAQ